MHQPEGMTTEAVVPGAGLRIVRIARDLEQRRS